MMISQEKLLSRKVKVCPVVIRIQERNRYVLVFRHPTSGIQFIKGTLEMGESVIEAAIRELFEESGLQSVSQNYLCSWDPIHEDQEWHFVACKTASLSDSWQHFTHDGGGLSFDFFWHPLQDEPSSEWHEVYRRALIKVRSIL